MTSPIEDKNRVVDEAEAIVKASRQIQFTAPLRVLYDVGSAVAVEVAAKGNRDGSPGRIILDKLEEIVPEELIDGGLEEFGGDLDLELPISLSSLEIDVISNAILQTPRGSTIVSYFSMDPKEAVELDSRRNDMLWSLLKLGSRFSEAGGEPDIAIAVRITTELG